ncbi:aldehyde dehydrogenase (plasmid) [Alkalihalophilus pseudofirmus OF4]|uniref:3-sulfolactaldehyde dehydrogenase n=1 Tax=Alkalihalophilus pseudofirmus (strain ATCC BAA-2126 / JCM 17055 / OF4) TaxID=398511 RepID=D3G1S4_ALKPO|nr:MULTISPECIES: aldehyde dehydrogenase family protein [Alkalihalophilus]ADC52300.1 aldehyde dehydrogenase [Alkalihalophilus pseudofirmus OF4]MED1603309.1 aldehyde dehydrogenase family protein [Alkalihalophilus marmarensis]
MTITKTDVFKNFINGEWEETKEVYEVTNPADTNEVVGKFPLSTEEDVDRAVKSANEAFLSWRKVPASERATYVYRFIDLLDQNKERLGEALCKEQGKPLQEAVTEVTRGVSEMRFVAGEAVRLDGTTLPSDRRGVINMSVRVPIGVVAAITPWNFPVLTPLRKVMPALVCGCTVVLKPATDTPLTSLIITQLLEEAGFPAGTVSLVMGRGRKVGEALVGHPLVKGVSFTGSTQVGRKIYETAAKNFTKVQLELGGNNPAVVAEYGDLEGAATQIVAGCYGNAGQRCTAIGRLIVLDKHADELEKLIVEKVKAYKVGNGMEEGTTIGPVISEGARQELEGYMETAKEEGATILIGGRSLKEGKYENGYYFEPTVISGVTGDMKVAKEEIFGPVLIVIRVSSFEEAIEVSNNTEYGLTASVFTDDMNLGYRYMEDIESGMVHINNGTVSEGHMPFGGVKNSGVGAYSIGGTNKDFYTELKVAYIQYK